MDCAKKKLGFGKCFKPKGHNGPCLSFSDTGPGLRPATEWSLEDSVKHPTTDQLCQRPAGESCGHEVESRRRRNPDRAQQKEHESGH